MYYFGAILILIGFSLRAIVIKELNVNLTWRCAKPIYLVKTGIYKHIRHPLYLCSMIDGAGLALLASHSYGITFLFLCLNFNWILDRIDREENFLLSQFGQEYLDYHNRVKYMLIPKVF